MTENDKFAQLQAAIDATPHDPTCDLTRIKYGIIGVAFPVYRTLENKCNCWKSAGMSPTDPAWNMILQQIDMPVEYKAEITRILNSPVVLDDIL